MLNSFDNKAKWTVSGTDTYEFVNLQNTKNKVNCNLRNYGIYGFACYSTSTGGALTLYKKIDVPITAISLDKASTTLRAGTTETLTATVTPENTTDAVSYGVQVTMNVATQRKVVTVWQRERQPLLQPRKVMQR